MGPIAKVPKIHKVPKMHTFLKIPNIPKSPKNPKYIITLQANGSQLYFRFKILKITKIHKNSLKKMNYR